MANRIIRLMIIDDDEDDIELFIHSANRVDESIECSFALSGAEGLNALRNAALLPDYIFLDLRMPGLSGQSCLEEIRKDSALCRIPVFIYTTSRAKKDVRTLSDGGATMFITKPSKPEEIFYLLSSIVGEQWRL